MFVEFPINKDNPEQSLEECAGQLFMLNDLLTPDSGGELTLSERAACSLASNLLSIAQTLERVQDLVREQKDKKRRPPLRVV